MFIITVIKIWLDFSYLPPHSGQGPWLCTHKSSRTVVVVVVGSILELSCNKVVVVVVVVVHGAKRS